MITVKICENLSECIDKVCCAGCIGTVYPETCWYPGKRINYKRWLVSK